jgi:hypothetical protein
VGAPYIETLRDNLLAGEIFFRPGWKPDFYARAVAIAALVALKRLHWVIHWVVVTGAGLGTLAYLAGIR